MNALKNCRVCGTSYGTAKISLLERNDQGAVAHITCPTCVHSSLVFLGKTGHGLGFLGLMTDLNFADAEHFRDRPEISEEVLFGANKLFSTVSRRFVAEIYYQSLIS